MESNHWNRCERPITYLGVLSEMAPGKGNCGKDGI